MQEIKCPNCGEIFAVDETGYAQIVKQVRDKEFEKEIERREKEIDEKKKSELELLRVKQQNEFKETLSKKEREIVDRDKTIEQLNAQINNKEHEKELAIKESENKKNEERRLEIENKNEEIAKREREIEKLKAQIIEKENEKKLAISETENKKDKERETEIENKNKEIFEAKQQIENLRAEIKNNGTEKELAVSKVTQEKRDEISKKEIEIIHLKSQLSNKEKEFELKEQSLHKDYESQLKLKDDQIEYYKDFKVRQSTKMVGESLERYCSNKFNSIRMTAFPAAYFEKDNDARTGSKGDFIFREEQDGVEFISIMFEMKNEMDTTATKHKNEDFFKELNKDRKEKNCEYAVLVSMLEMDNDLYNDGIVDVSYKYDKMYVIRPQFFIPIITLLRNAALNSLNYRKELNVIKEQQIDIFNFEKNMNDFKYKFTRNYDIASRKFKEAIDEIDKTITHLQKTKDALISSENNLRLANQKAEDLSIKRLTKNAPAVKEMFDELKNMAY